MPSLGSYSQKLITIKLTGVRPITCTLSETDERGAWLVGDTLFAELSEAYPSKPRDKKPNMVFAPFGSIEWMMLY
jgi:hypothetical protein